MLLLAAAVSLAAACGNGGTGTDDTTTTSGDTTTTSTTSASETTTTTTDDGVALTQRCTNPEAGYGIEFPEGWSTNAGDVSPPCRYFHPEPFGVPENTEVFDLAVLVRVDDVPFDRVAAPGDSLAERELQREETTVAGLQAVRLEAESTGDALLSEGVRSYRYHVDLDGQTLTATTHDVEDLDYEANKETLDRMMETLAFNGG